MNKPPISGAPAIACGVILWMWMAAAAAHGVSDSGKQFLQGAAGVQIMPYLYLGANHMVTCGTTMRAQLAAAGTEIALLRGEQ